jgi:ubiquinone/menaquinone biosynthesis C-methylase UbiE
MKLSSLANALKTVFGRGMFPHEWSVLLETPLRRFLLSPRVLADRLALSPTSRVLEVGAGSGVYSVEVARRIPRGHLELLDLQPEMLEKARRRLAAEGLSNVGYTPADAGKLPFEGQSFDVAFLVTVLGEVSDRESFLGEVRRVLRPGGVLSISEHLPDPDFSPFARVKSLVEKAGFESFERHGAWWSYTANFRRAGSP